MERTDPTTVAPALTAEEWREFIDDRRLLQLGGTRDAHKCAARFLYGQPFGFTREDVLVLRYAAKELHHFGLVTLADRVEALLPPR